MRIENLFVSRMMRSIGDAKPVLEKKVGPGEEHFGGSEDVRTAVYGMTDALVEIVALGAGVYGYVHDAHSVIIAGLALVFAGATAMFFGEYLSTRSKNEIAESAIKKEMEEMKNIPDKEKEEIREVYRAKGFSPEEVELITNKITSNDKVWLDTMLTEELKIFPESQSGILRGAAITWISYFLSGFVPLIPYFLLSVNQAFLASVLVASLVLFGVGGAKSFFTHKSFLRSGVEMALIGMGAAALSFGVGTAINAVFHPSTFVPP